MEINEQAVKLNEQAVKLNEIIKENNPAIHNLLSEKGKSIFFPKLGIISQSAEAKGKKFNATAGIAIEEDYSPMRLNSISNKVLLDPKEVFLYAPSYGNIELREKWKEIMKEKNPSLVGKTSLPVVTNALTHGLSILGYLFVNPGDKIILTDKFWGNYELIFEQGCLGKLDVFNTFKGKGFDLESFRNKLFEKQGKKIVLLNFPNNPTGYTPTNEEAEAIIQIIKESAEQGNEILVILDDAYFGLVYKEGIYKESLFSKLSDLHENVLVVKVDGATKEDYVWGFRVGFLTYASKGITDKTCNALETKTAGAIRGNISNASNLSQSLVLTGLNSLDYKDEKKQKYELLKSRFNEVQEVLKDNKFFEFFSVLPNNSGYFICIELKGRLVAEEIRRTLLEKYDTGVISTGNLLRITFASIAKKDIKQLFENIYLACQEANKKINSENKMSKLTIVGAGNVGSQTAFYAALKEISKEVVLIDVVDGLPQGKALDLLEAMPIASSNTKVIGSNNYETSKDSEVVVITAGIARKPGMTREDLIEINSKIMKSVISEVVKYSPNCILIVVSNPLDAMVHLAYKLSGFPKNKVIGMAGVLDTTRFRTFISQELNSDVNEVEALVLGSHGDLMIPVLSNCRVGGKPITELLSEEKLKEIIKRVKHGGAEIVGLLKTGSAFFAPGLAIIEMVESILNDQKKILPCSVLLNGEYGVEGNFIGVPVKLGKEGVEEIIELELSEEEKEEFNKSAEHIKELVGKLDLN